MITPSKVSANRACCYFCGSTSDEIHIQGIELIIGGSYSAPKLCKFENSTVSKTIDLCNECYLSKIYDDTLFKFFKSDIEDYRDQCRTCNKQLDYNTEYYVLYAQAVEYNFHRECWKIHAGDDLIFSD